MAFNSAADNEFAARATGGVRFISGIDPSTTGVQLAAGSGAWSAISDRNVKENFAPGDAQEMLVRVAALPISTWNYMTQDESIRHVGPMAQDLYAAFGVGEDERHINSIDADGIALAAIQELYQENQELQKQVIELQELVNKLIEERR